MGTNYTIRELVDEFDVTPRTIRFYEERGLISPGRRGSVRVYDARDRTRLKLILRGKRLGFGLEEIREILELYEFEDGEIWQLERCLELGREKVAALERQKQDIEATLQEILGFGEHFAALIEEKEAKSSTPMPERALDNVGGRDADHA